MSEFAAMPGNKALQSFSPSRATSSNSNSSGPTSNVNRHPSDVPSEGKNGGAQDFLKKSLNSNPVGRFFFGNDINTFDNPNSTLVERGVAGFFIIGSIAPPTKVLKIFKPTRNLSGGEATTKTILGAAEEWLGPGFKEIDNGVFRSSDDLRHFRMDEGSLLDARQGPHVSVESIADDRRIILENTHVKILDP